MRYVVLSDIHGNYDALIAVLRDIEQFTAEQRAPIDYIWCLGDLVGYGPEPRECVQTIREMAKYCVAGNHDWAAIGKLDLDDFTDVAANSAKWTAAQLGAQDRIYLRSLPEVEGHGEFTLAHGSPMNPIWEYLTSPLAATPNFAAFTTPYCLVGHTHVPTIFLLPDDVTPLPPPPDILREEQGAPQSFAPGDSDLMMPFPDMGLMPLGAGSLCEHITPAPGLWLMPEHRRAIINPGSVGQPRDGDPRASYVIFDSDLGFEFRRVEYDVASTQRKMSEQGLSPRMAARLERGL
ncbi:MAG: metallophosphoesterase family protein [Chloroflexota bacterium]|nr:metallophosphoesterase family protein [Chloroflexota bacterium]